MLNFTIGPVMSPPEVIAIASQSTPYFRTPEFSALMKENESLMLRFLKAPTGSKCAFLTASGTGAMESVVMNVTMEDDKIIVINGGTFGQRFVDLCRLYNRNFQEVTCEFGKQLKREQLSGLEDGTVMLINMHETSSGLLYDMEMVSEFCRENRILLIVDAISSFLADELDMASLGAGVVITSSQKALACQPGVSAVALGAEAMERVDRNQEACLYLSLKEALKDGQRGQTPYTPAVSILMQIHARLRAIEARGGVESERKAIGYIAEAFRLGIANLPYRMVADTPSNAVTALHPTSAQASNVVNILKDQYNIWVCPNGGEYKDTVFRVGHVGNISAQDNTVLLRALRMIA